MRIAIGSDHAGLEMKKTVSGLLSELGYEIADYGTCEPQSVDYPDYGEKVAAAVSEGRADRGILVCGTGIGMSIVANKFPHVRAALCNELFAARMSRQHNDANILVLAGRIVGADLAREIALVWLNTEFEGGRHQKRIEKIDLIEKKILEKNIKERQS
jgi:ribose 5-phosphate isomerase B